MQWAKCLEPFPCPKCSHSNVISVIPIKKLVEQYSLLDVNYKNKLQEYKEKVQAASLKKDGSRQLKPAKLYNEPKKPTCPKQYMVCMCCVSKCRNIVDGRGCHHCAGLAKNGIKIPFNVKLAECECALCCCNCDIKFPKTSWQSIATQLEQERDEKVSDHEMKKSKIFTSDKEGMSMLCQLYIISNTRSNPN